MAKVSYLMASYNHAKYIEQTIQSILDQSYPIHEICIVDDGSTDNSVELINNYAAQDERIKLFPIRNQGVTNARNFGFTKISGEFVSIVDSDDLYPLDRTARMVAALEKDPSLTMVFGDADIIDQHGSVTGRFNKFYPVVQGDFAIGLFSSYCFVPAASVMFRKDAFEKSGNLWGPAANIDYIKWIELGILGKVQRIEGEALGQWRRHSKNMSKMTPQKRIKTYEELQKALLRILEKYPRFKEKIPKSQVQERFKKLKFFGGFHAALQGDHTLARIGFNESLEYSFDPASFIGKVATSPILRDLAHPVYKLIAKWKLPG